MRGSCLVSRKHLGKTHLSQSVGTSGQPLQRCGNTQMRQLTVTHPASFFAGPRAEAAPSCCHLLPEVLVSGELFRTGVVDDLMSPSGSALSSASPPATITLAALPPASLGGRMAQPAIFLLPQITRYGSQGMCGVTRQRQERF